MTLFNRCKGIAITLLGFCLSLVGLQADATAFTSSDALEAESAVSNQTMTAQNGPICDYEWQEVQYYARVATQEDPLRVRATPGGQAIGSIPKGWAVVVVEIDETGDWTKVTSHFGDISGDIYETVFASAPGFRSGWVATRYLENLGEFCEKPMNLMVQPVGTSEITAAAVQEDWLALGDRIASTQ